MPRLSLLIIFFLALDLGMASAGEFKPIPAGSADQSTKVEGAGAIGGKVWALGSRIRLENDLAGTHMAAIMDLEKRQAFMLRKPPKGCVQKPLNDKTKHPSAWPPPGAKQELVGSETIDGHPTKKYKVTRDVDGEKLVSYVWRATDLKDWPIRVTDESGRFEILYTNVSLAKPDPKLFEPPADCSIAAKDPERKRK